jgi:hypothetical protein
MIDMHIDWTDIIKGGYSRVMHVIHEYSAGLFFLFVLSVIVGVFTFIIGWAVETQRGVRELEVIYEDIDKVYQERLPELKALRAKKEKMSKVVEMQANDARLMEIKAMLDAGQLKVIEGATLNIKIDDDQLPKGLDECILNLENSILFASSVLAELRNLKAMESKDD